MFDFLFRFTHKKPYKNRLKTEKPKTVSSSTQNTQQASQKITAEIDYDKLTDAIIEANNKILRQKEQNEIIEYEQRKENWKKALLGNEYKGDIEHASKGQIFWALMSFKKENATGDNTIFALFQIINILLLSIYEVVFYITTLFGVISAWSAVKNIISNWANITIYLQSCIEAISTVFFAIAMIITPLIIGRVIRVARLQLNNCKNKQFVITIFNTLVTFTSLIIAIITMFVTRGG